MKKHIGVELRSLSHLIMRQIEKDPRKQAIDAITGTNGWIIGYLLEQEGQAVYQKDLEAEFGITRSTASKVVILMEKKGLIVRKSVAHDARLKKLELTPRAKELGEIMKTHQEQTEHRLMRGFSEEETATLFCYIQRMKENMS